MKGFSHKKPISCNPGILMRRPGVLLLALARNQDIIQTPKEVSFGGGTNLCQEEVTNIWKSFPYKQRSEERIL